MRVGQKCHTPCDKMSETRGEYVETYLLGGFARKAPEHGLHAAFVSVNEIVIGQALKHFLHGLRNCLKKNNKVSNPKSFAPRKK